MTILLIGKTGQLGGSLLRVSSNHNIIAPGRDELDIQSIETCKASIKEYDPDVVINTAAFHNLPMCEDEPLRAFEVNCVAVRDLARICRDAGALFVTFSTDYVFGGEQNQPYKEHDRTNPLQVYGISRLAGELAALAVAPEHTVIIRTCGLYGLSGAKSKEGNFVDKRIADARNNSVLEMGCDQVVSPTFAEDLAKAVLLLIESPAREPGIYHLVNEGQCTWFEFTKTIYEKMGFDVDLRPVDRGGLSGKMRRPLYSVLANTKARGHGVALPHWQDGLVRYLRQKYGLPDT